MQYPIPNSDGHREVDEANTMGTHAYLQRGPKKRKRVREFNPCHSPADGTFCSTGNVQWRRTLRGRNTTAGKRASDVMGRLDQEMRRVGGNVARALTLRKRMDKAGPLAQRHRQNTFVGTFRRIFSQDPSYRGGKR